MPPGYYTTYMTIQYSHIAALKTLVKQIHKAPRADGAPYWTHPLRCHKLLLDAWKEASIESEIAMLFHDTLADIEGGETIIQDALNSSQKTWLQLDKRKTFRLVENLTTPQGIPREQAISEIEHRFKEQRVEPEAYLLKAIDMMDNTSDLISFYQKSPNHREIHKHMKPQRLQKYTGYLMAIHAGLLDNPDIKNEERPGMGKALENVLNTVKRNLQAMEKIIYSQSNN